MAARFSCLRRALSLSVGNQTPRVPSFQGKLSHSESLLSRDYTFQRQFCAVREANEASVTSSCSTSSNSPTDLVTPPSPLPTSADLLLNYTSQLKINPRHDFMMVFTCKVCETRSMKMASRESYDNGVVVVRCGGCDNLHLISDRRGWFGEPGSVEDFLSANGQEFKKGSMDSLSLTYEDLAGAKIPTTE